MHGRAFCSEMENFEFRMMDGPTSHGSSRMVKEPGKVPGEASGAGGGRKTSRNDVSPLSDVTESDMAVHTQRVRRPWGGDSMEESDGTRPGKTGREWKRGQPVSLSACKENERTLCERHHSGGTGGRGGGQDEAVGSCTRRQVQAKTASSHSSRACIISARQFYPIQY